MIKYTKPTMTIAEEMAEGVYADGSGQCTYGRKYYNPNADKCQRCQGQSYNYNMAEVCPQGRPKKANNGNSAHQE